MGRGITVLICLLCLTLGSWAAAPDSLWSARFGGNSHDVCNAVAPTSDGGYVLAGWTKTYGAGWYDFWLVKTDGAGDTVWNKTYGGPEGEGCFAVQQTPDGGFILAGMTGSFGEEQAGPSDAWVVKTDANGDSLWSKLYGGPQSDGFYAVQLAADGGYVFAGFTDSYGKGSRDFWLVKTDANGDTSWTKTYGAGGFDECHAMVRTGDGGYALAGTTESFRLRDQNFYLIKVDGNGESVWTTPNGNGKVYGTAQDDACYALAQSLDGGFALAGSTVNSNTQHEDFWLVRTTANGDSMWAHSYGTNSREVCYALQATQDSSYVLAGASDGLGSGLWDFWMMKADPRGNTVYRRTFGGPEREVCFGMAKTADGGFALGGYTRSFGAAYEDFWQVKTGGDVLITPPDNFTLITPSNDTTYANNQYSFRFRWHVAANHDDYDTVSYRLFISDTLTFDTAYTDTSDALRDTTINWTRMVVANIPHYWKVQAMDMGGWTTWSTETRTFRVLGTAPSPFDLAFPADSAMIPDSFSIRLRWFKATDPDPSDTRTYTVFLSRDSTFATFDTMSVTDSSALWTRLIVANQRTFWKVRATDRHGLVTWSNQTWSFTIVAHAPDPFALLEPADSARIPDNASVIFKWRKSTDADSAHRDSVLYVIYVSTDSLTTFDTLYVLQDTSVHWVKPLPPQRYWWKVKAFDRHGLYTWSDLWTFVRFPHEPVQQPPQGTGPTVFNVYQNYPNPFNSTTLIVFDLPNAGWVRVKVFNILGREVETLVNQYMAAGSWRTSFDATDMPSGLYILRVEAPGVTQMKKMMLLK